MATSKRYTMSIGGRGINKAHSELKRFKKGKTMKSILKNLTLLGAMLPNTYDFKDAPIDYSASNTSRRSTKGDYTLKKMIYNNQLSYHSSWYKKFKRLKKLEALKHASK